MKMLCFCGLLTKGMFITLGLIITSMANAGIVTLNFESVSSNTNAGVGVSYSESGFTLEALQPPSNPALAVIGTSDPKFSGSTALINDRANGITRLTRNSGGLFDFLSIDLAELTGGAASVEFTANSGGTQNFTLDGVAFGAQTFNFSQAFLGVESVSWVQVSPFHQFDNLNLRTNAEFDQVPTPASLALFGLGLAGLGWSRRRKA